jgi:hypothetical protein
VDGKKRKKNGEEKKSVGAGKRRRYRTGFKLKIIQRVRPSHLVGAV